MSWIQIRSSQALTFGSAPQTSMDAEEAIVVALLAIGMSVLVGLTIMIFW